MKKLFVIFIILLLVACGTTQKPVSELPTYQVVDNSQTTIIVGDNNKANPVARPETTNAPSSTMDTESTRDMSMVLIVWFVIALALVGGGLYVWWRRK